MNETIEETKDYMEEMVKMLKKDNHLDVDMFDPKYINKLLGLKGINLKEKKIRTKKDLNKKKIVKKSRKQNRKK